jgi:hypothetical protein
MFSRSFLRFSRSFISFSKGSSFSDVLKYFPPTSGRSFVLISTSSSIFYKWLVPLNNYSSLQLS